ncbi:MAG: hypothetical protein CEO40_320, partial [Parcubacteria group bacterium LiPW_72]
NLQIKKEPHFLAASLKGGCYDKTRLWGKKPRIEKHRFYHHEKSGSIQVSVYIHYITLKKLCQPFTFSKR